MYTLSHCIHYSFTDDLYFKLPAVLINKLIAFIVFYHCLGTILKHGGVWFFAPNAPNAKNLIYIIRLFFQPTTLCCAYSERLPSLVGLSSD